MSDLKYRSVAQLRETVARCARDRAKQREEKARKTKEIERLQAEVDRHGKLDHNIGQREAWARYYLAKKELEGAK